ncbi:unnamed protein product [Effrenium voratum]|nr:unnamed protein product [Effrenium voratum]
MAKSVLRRVLVVCVVATCTRRAVSLPRAAEAAEKVESLESRERPESRGSGPTNAGFQEVTPGPSGEGMKRARQFLALEPLDDEVNQWEQDMAQGGLSAEEERKKWVAIVSGAVTFLLGGSYVLLNVMMDSTDWSGFAGERTLSAEDLQLLGKEMK